MTAINQWENYFKTIPGLRDIPELNSLIYEKKKTLVKALLIGATDYSRWENFSNLNGVDYDIKSILAWLKLVTLAEDENIELMMDPSHTKLNDWFNNLYKEFRTNKKKKTAA